MVRQLCIVHANCQGEPLIERLNLCPAFRERYTCRLFTNYIRESIPGETLDACALFLYQHLGPDWGELASDRLLARLPDAARSLCIPNMFFKGYWPTWSGREGFNYRCTLLDSLIDAGLPAEDVVALYLHTDLAAKYDLHALLAETLKREQEREARTPVKYLDLIRAQCHATPLFNTVNHPGPRLMNHAACAVLHELGLPAPDAAALAALGDPFPECEQPIHPKTAAFFGWDFAGPDRQYAIYGRPMTFAQWVARYVTARRAGISDFIAFLQSETVS